MRRKVNAALIVVKRRILNCWLLSCLAILMSSCYSMEDMKDIQNKFGFTHSTPYHDGEEILIINHVVEGGIFDQSGLIEGDQIIVPSSVNGFYQLLKRHPDNNINIEIYRKVTGRNIKITISSK